MSPLTERLQQALHPLIKGADGTRPDVSRRTFLKAAGAAAATGALVAATDALFPKTATAESKANKLRAIYPYDGTMTLWEHDVNGVGTGQSITLTQEDAKEAIKAGHEQRYAVIDLKGKGFDSKASFAQWTTAAQPDYMTPVIWGVGEYRWKDTPAGRGTSVALGFHDTDHARDLQNYPMLQACEPDPFVTNDFLKSIMWLLDANGSPLPGTMTLWEHDVNGVGTGQSITLTQEDAVKAVDNGQVQRYAVIDLKGKGFDSKASFAQWTTAAQPDYMTPVIWGVGEYRWKDTPAGRGTSVALGFHDTDHARDLQNYPMLQACEPDPFVTNDFLKSIMWLCKV